MKRMVSLVSLALSVFVTGPSAASAQGAPGVRFGISGGADFPTEDQRDVFKTGWNGTALVAINFGTAPIGLRIDGSYHEMKVKEDLFFFSGDSGKVRIVSGTADIVLGPKNLAVEPYFLGGVGAYDLRFRGQEINTRNAFSDSTTRFGWNAGGGLAFRLGGSSSRMFIEARYTSVSTNGNRFSDSVRSGGSRFTFIPVNVGFVF